MIIENQFETLEFNNSLQNQLEEINQRIIDAYKPLYEVTELINDRLLIIAKHIAEIGEYVQRIINNFVDELQEKLQVIISSYELEEITSCEFLSDDNSMPNAPPIYNFNNTGNVIVNNYTNCVINVDSPQRFLTFDRVITLVSLLISIIPYLPVIIDFLKAFF